jgi:ferredoxin-nitrate reductase
MAVEVPPPRSRDAIADIWGERTPYVGEWPVRVDQYTTTEPDTWVQSACVLCSNGCGMDIGVRDGRIVGVRGRAVDRTSHGRLGPKGLYGWQANHAQDRLTTPLIRRDGKLEPATWDEAMELIVSKTRQIKEDIGAGAIGFYNTGQMFLEEYYTLGVMADAGIGTNNLDGNTRLCTATASVAYIESFGTDGHPGSYTDFDTTDAIFCVGHNPAATITVLWSRILDRLDGPNPPALVVVDPRMTASAKRATVHLAPKVGTNLPLLNGLLNQLIERGWIDQAYVDEHTVGFDKLVETVASFPLERVAQMTGIPKTSLEAAAEIVGTAPTLVSTVLQGVYQSLQATASAVQVNNLHLLRGMIGKPGCTVFQLNGQPTSQNTRECGANGELFAFRNWQNEKHIEELAKLWNVDPLTVPHWKPPTHAMEIFRLCETGSIRFLWIIATNPAVSLPELKRVRKILKADHLFVVVQDPFMSETAELADVVLPAAMWAEKTGCFTNTDRTVHISHQAISPPGEARSDLDIFLDYARRMDFRDKDGEPLIKWSDPEGAFDAWKECSRGRPCDYSGLSYARLSEGSGIQWPVNSAFPDGAERLYTDGKFNTAKDYCEEYGHDLTTGATIERSKYQDPKGKAFLKAADYQPPAESPDGGYPLLLTTGRVAFQFHTRTKTGRVAQLASAAPDPFVQLSAADAAGLGIVQGDRVRVTSRRGSIVAAARVGEIEPGMVFVPFHYGSWDVAEGDEQPPRAANELTITGWDAVSKQPHFKYAAVKVEKVAEA